jgi:hypothetical protein
MFLLAFTGLGYVLRWLRRRQEAHRLALADTEAL